MAISFKEWIARFTRAKHEESNAASTEPESAPLLLESVDPVEAEAAGLNFHSAIVSHQKLESSIQSHDW